MVLKKDYTPFIDRRERLIEVLNAQSSDAPWVVFIVGEFEQSRIKFRQASSVYYLSGITDPAVIIAIYSDGRQIGYIPNYQTNRSQWAECQLEFSPPGRGNSVLYGLNEVKYTGGTVKGYSFKPQLTKDFYGDILKDFSSHLGDKGTIYYLHEGNLSVTSAWQLWFLSSFPENRHKDITPVVNAMRREKDEEEFSCLKAAADVTKAAHEVAAQMMEPGIYEYELHAAIECVFIQCGNASAAFPSIVATGKNATVLHYTANNSRLNDGELVVIDIGAEFKYYASDVSRTYPVSGMFTEEQQELYRIVLEAQEYIAEVARPGMFLRNASQPEYSLQHLAQNFFKERKLQEYFPHAIGHFLGLDTHDVGDLNEPLKSGDVITIEPGIYIPKKGMGIRIEDDYVIVDDGTVCLSDELVKEPEEIEELMSMTAEMSI